MILSFFEYYPFNIWNVFPFTYIFLFFAQSKLVCYIFSSLVESMKFSRKKINLALN